MNDKMSRYNKQMGARKFPYENLQLGVANLWVSLREPSARRSQTMGFLTRNWWFPYEKPEASNWGKSFSRLGAYFQRTYVHGFTNLCSWVREPMFMGSRTYVLRNVLVLVMMMIGANVWGAFTEGLYFIQANSDATFYLCPSIGCYYGNNVDQPHLTTFKTGGDQNSVWKIEPVEDETDTYYIIHYKTGRYLKSNEDFTTDNGSKHNRKAVHLEVKPETLTDEFKFLIKDNSGSYQIYPKVYYTNPSGMSFNPTGGHKECYAPLDGGVQGMIGLFNKGDDGSKWKINSVPSESIPCATPIIKYDGDNINISYPYTDETGITIYYTTDGTQPTTSSSSSSSASFNIPSSGVVKVRAIATKTNYVNSDEAVLWGSARPFLIQSKECEDYYLVPSGNGNNVTTSSLPGTSMQWTLQNAGASTGGVQYYYVKNSNGKLINYNLENYNLPLNTEPADANKFCVVENGYNTGKFFLIPVSNLSRCLFKNNGNVDPSVSKAEPLKDYGTQGRDQWTLKACNEGANQKDLFSAPPFSVSDADEAHYYLIQSLGNSGYYIIPPSATDGYVQTSNSNYSDVPWVFKKAGEDNWLTYYYIINAATGKFMHFNLNDKLTGDETNVVSMKDVSEKNADNEDKFQYVMVPSTTPGACYIVPKGYSYADDNHINFRDNKYYGLWENSGDALKTTWSRSSTANHVKWTFSEKAPLSFYIDPDITQDENGYVTISHLVNACDFYYTTDGTTTPVVPADGSDPVAPTYKYSGPFLPPLGASKIIAKAAIKGDHSITSNPVELEFSALAQPTITFDNATSTVTITSLPGATIYYAYGSIDPADPTVDEGITHGDSPVTFTVSEKTYIKALAVKGGFTPSAVQSATIDKVAAPVTDTTSDGKVKLTSTTPSVTIYYEIGDDESSVATPTTSSTRYTGPLQNVSGKVIKAIAVKDGWITSDVGGSNGIITLQCAMPVIRRGTGNTFTISSSFPAEGVSIYYTTGSDDPTTLYVGPVSISSYPVTVKAIATADNYSNSSLAEVTIIEDLVLDGDYYLISSAGDFEKFVSKASTADGAGYKYKVTDDFTYSSTFEITQAFTGTFDGGFYTITGLKNPLFVSLDGGTVKNVVLDPNTTVNGNGAICNEADGSTKIYNCGVLSGTISGSGNVGGLVGHIASGSSVRVVNCYNFAAVSGGTTMAGIVGNNEGTVGDVRIAMCMMYGDMSGGTSPVYAGNHVTNVKNYTEYNYWRNKADLSYTTYNDQLAIDKDEYLTRFPFYRHILNTHRELAAFFLFGESGETVKDITANEVAEIGHWVLNKDLAPYPIVEEWKTNTKRTTVDIANNLPDTTEKGAGKLLNDIGDDGYYSGTGTNITKISAMGNNGYLTVNVSINGSDYSASLPITDMNEANYDYTWGKVVLPFANEFSGWTRDYSKVCTGWEITSITGGTAGTFANYNVSDRDCTAKDLYSNSGYIFAQGGNYIVPYGVTAINIKAHFANAFYLSDASYDVGYSANFDDPVSLGGDVSPSYHEQTVYTDLSTLVNALSETTNPHDQAIVLVGNYHYNIKTLGGSKLETAKAVTIMSTDEDCNQEPDYGWYTCNTSGRLEVPPLRFDFVPNIEMGMSSRVGSSLYPGIGIWHTRGWFELTETCVSNMSQCEINSDNFTFADNGKGNNRWIANSGCFVQIVRARDGNCNKLSYIQIGGNAYVKELYPGSHTDNARESATVPIAVTGGQVDECYMTGYKAGAKLTGDMIYFWCGGGKIKKFLGAYLENPTAAGITAKVDHALVGRFFGGGTSGAARIKGNIDITINNSQVDFYCGGPEFGNMESGKGVTTHAIGTTFGEYYGAGFGGTSITYNREQQTNNLNITNNATTTYDLGFSTYYKRLTNKPDYGIGCCYKFEYIFHSNGSNGVTRFYTGYAQFDLATTGNVTNVLNYCTIKKLPGTNSPTPKESTGDFYGAGCQGKVNGTVTSTLTNCEVDGSAFGGGFKAANNEVEVYPTTAPTYSVYTKETGIFSDFGTVKPEKFTWKQGTNDDNTKEKTADDTNKILYTSKDITMTDLGNVTGAISLTIDGNSVIGTEGKSETGNVFGGGNESKSLDNTTVTLKGNTQVRGNVFGGGNNAVVQGTATVNIVEK